MFGGIYSKSKYAIIGGIRGAIARVGYEVCFTLNIILFILHSKSCTLTPLGNRGLIIVFSITFFRVLVELGRTPFDYRESERELVSGFNTEYSAAGFVLIFLKEYGSLLFFSIVLSTIFFGGYTLITVVIFSSFIFIRRSLPRVRPDVIVSIIWLTVFFCLGGVFFCTFIILLL